MKTYLKNTALTAIVFLMFACKSTKTVSTEETSFNLNTKQVIREHQKRTPSFKTLQSRLKIDYKNGEDEQSHTVTLRIQKDKTIWLSAKLNLVRAIITPERVSFYNKLDNTYFEGDFQYLSDLLGTELNFQKIQNILLGQTVYSLKNTTYALSRHENSYLLQPKIQEPFFEIFFLINPSHFKLDSQQVAQPAKMRMMEVDYLTYQDVEKQILPERLKLIALQQSSETIINLEFKSVVLNQDLRFPFKIPSGFKAIQL
ncbi:MAG TPA: DUF4292 domain-containing protein [Flavobacteriaceae bacterium]|nr:DUF4292 domain-containing protein [Flavobacteriaceae bacterium]